MAFDVVWKKMRYLPVFLLGLTLGSTPIMALSIHDPLNEVRLIGGIEGDATLAEWLLFLADYATNTTKDYPNPWSPKFVLVGAETEITIVSSSVAPTQAEYRFDPENNPNCVVNCQRELYLADALNLVTFTTGTRWRTKDDTIVVYFPTDDEKLAEEQLLSGSYESLLVQGQLITKVHLIEYISQFPTRRTTETLLKVVLNKAEYKHVRQNALFSFWRIVSPSDKWSTPLLQDVLNDKDALPWSGQRVVEILLITEPALRDALPKRPDVSATRLDFWDQPDPPIEEVLRFLERKAPKDTQPGGAAQPATAPNSKLKGKEKLQPEAEGRPQ